MYGYIFCGPLSGCKEMIRTINSGRLYLCYTCDFLNIISAVLKGWQHIQCSHFWKLLMFHLSFYGKFGFQGRFRFLASCLSELCWEAFHCRDQPFIFVLSTLNLVFLFLNLCLFFFFFYSLMYSCEEVPFVAILKVVF